MVCTSLCEPRRHIGMYPIIPHSIMLKSSSSSNKNTTICFWHNTLPPPLQCRFDASQTTYQHYVTTGRTALITREGTYQLVATPCHNPQTKQWQANICICIMWPPTHVHTAHLVQPATDTCCNTDAVIVHFPCRCQNISQPDMPATDQNTASSKQPSLRAGRPAFVLCPPIPVTYCLSWLISHC